MYNIQREVGKDRITHAKGPSAKSTTEYLRDRLSSAPTRGRLPARTTVCCYIITCMYTMRMGRCAVETIIIRRRQDLFI